MLGIWCTVRRAYDRGVYVYIVPSQATVAIHKTIAGGGVVSRTHGTHENLSETSVRVSSGLDTGWLSQ